MNKLLIKEMNKTEDTKGYMLLRETTTTTTTINEQTESADTYHFKSQKIS